jgi:alpha-methylacyl-CoA racemase
LTASPSRGFPILESRVCDHIDRLGAQSCEAFERVIDAVDPETKQPQSREGKEMPGPLAGFKIIEMVGIGPAPFGAMVLADMGAEVLRIDRVGGGSFLSGGGGPADVLGRNRKSASINIKDPRGVEAVLDLVEQADGFVEGLRPGVMERLGLGPDVCRARNPKLVYGRMTGWGQEGTYKDDVGHDINYAAVTGALHTIGRRGQRPTPPVNYLADFGGGGLLLAFGMVTALLERERSGEGQVVDAAMCDGVALLSSSIFGAAQAGFWNMEPGTNMLDTGAHFYDVYECKDGRYVSVGAIEPQFYVAFLEVLGLSGEDLPNQMDMSAWPKLKERVEAIFKTKTRDEWCAAMEGHEVCFSPVLTMTEAPDHPHNASRGVFVDVGDGKYQPAPAPRFSRSETGVHKVASVPGAETIECLEAWGLEASRIEELRNAGVIG